jgi:hypothetical protein
MNRSLGDQKARLIATESVKSLIQSVEGQINNNNNSISSCNGAVSNQESRQTGGVFITEPSREVPADQLLRLDDWGVKQWSLSVQQQLSAEIYYWLTSAKHWIEKNG